MSGDFDPRDVDSRERDDGIHDREDEWLTLVRGPGSAAVRDGSSEDDVRDRDDDWREARDRESRNRDDDRGIDPRDVFMRDLDLPRGPERELVHDRDRDYTLNGSESRTLSTVGASRVVSERDLRDPRDDAFDLRHLEDQGLIQRVPLNEQERAVTLTDHGRGLLERHRENHSDHRQAFYAGADKARERTHDAQLYRAYLKAAERLLTREARILRVELDRELKREYQRFLQERNRGDRDSDGRPDRTLEEIQEWAREHDLPYFDEQVHFPDVRIEYEEPNGDVRWEDLEVTTEHYRGGHASVASRSGFSIHSSGGSGGRGGAFDPRVAEDFL
jgi:DNA-binding MarR family transcriptional regulator